MVTCEYCGVECPPLVCLRGCVHSCCSECYDLELNKWLDHATLGSEATRGLVNILVTILYGPNIMYVIRQ